MLSSVLDSLEREPSYLAFLGKFIVVIRLAQLAQGQWGAFTQPSSIVGCLVNMSFWPCRDAISKLRVMVIAPLRGMNLAGLALCQPTFARTKTDQVSDPNPLPEPFVRTTVVGDLCPILPEPTTLVRASAQFGQAV